MLMTCSIVAVHAGLSYSQLSLILQYLASVHRMLKDVNPEAPELTANDVETDDIIARLLGPERAPPPLPTDGPQVWPALPLPYPPATAF